MVTAIRMFIATLLAAVPVTAVSADAVYRYQGNEEPVRDIQEGDLTYLSITDLGRVTGCSVRWDPLAFQARLLYGRSDLTATMLSSYVRLDDQLLNITYPALYRKGDLYVPAATFVEVLDYLVPLSLIWDDAIGVIRAEESWYNVIDLSFDLKMNGYLIEIILTEKLPYEVYVSEQKWINVNIFGGNLDDKRMSNRPRPKAIKGIRAFQFDGSSQIAVKFFRTITKFHHGFTTNPPRIQISIVDPAFNPALLDTVEADQLGMLKPIDVIVIDAGHGGDEDGAVGPGGTKEKDIVLSIAKRVQALLEADSGLTVVMTRTSDTTLTLQERATIAGRSGGDLFISLHANASTDNPNACGSQTFYLGTAAHDDARATALLENRSLALDRGWTDDASRADLDFVLLDVMQTEYLGKSRELAIAIQDRMADKLSIRSRGVDQAGFHLLNIVFMPSVLVELAFISNKREEALLKKESFQQKAAEAVYEGIRKFIDKHGTLN